LIILRLTSVLIAALTALASVFSCGVMAHAQGASAPARAVSASAQASETKPSWAELNALQKQALTPLERTWTTMSEAQKRKWLELSKNYPSLSAMDKTVMHSRMLEWVALSPQQRAQARLNFAKTKELSTQLTPDEKQTKWQAYQALSPEEKQDLAAKAAPKSTGAAVAVKPVAPQKLAVAPKSPNPSRPASAAVAAADTAPAPSSVPAAAPATQVAPAASSK
jgi:Protein of unknown function (DUF3106)